MRPPLLTLLIVLTICAGSQSQAALDAAAWHWHGQLEIPTLWDDALQEQFAPPLADVEWDKDRDVHTLVLEPSAVAYLSVPQGRWVRLQTDVSMNLLQQLDISRSRDGHLFSPENVQSLRGENDILLSQRESAPTLVRIALRNTAAPVRLRVFYSRLYAAEPLPEYRELLAMPERLQPVALAQGPGEQRFWRLPAGENLDVEVQGPMRIALEARVELGPGADIVPQYTPLRVFIDDVRLADLHLRVAPETRALVWVDRCAAAVSRSARTYIDIPEGEHRLRLRSPEQLLLRLRADRAEREYLFDGNDLPGTSRNRQMESDVPHSAQQLLAKANDPRFRADVLRPAANLRAAWPIGWRGADVADLVDDLHGAYSFFRDLVPVSDGSPVVQRVARFEVARLRAEGDVTRLPLPLLDEYARAMPSGYFSPVPDISAPALRYRLDPAPYARQLRVALHVPQFADEGDGAARRVYVQFDDGPVQSLHWYGERVLHASDRDPGLTALAHAYLVQDRGFAPAARGWSNEDSSALPIMETAVAMLALPSGARSIRFWSEKDDAWLALQARWNRPMRIREQAYLPLLNGKSAQHLQELFQQALLRYEAETTDSAFGLTELERQWRPLVRRVVEAAEHAGLAQAAVLPAASSIATGTTASLHDRAESAEHQQDWVAAIEAWSGVIAGSTGAVRGEARLRRALALLEQGEYLLGERELMQLTVADNADTARARARRYLFTQLQEPGREQARIGLLSALLLRESSAETMRELLFGLFDAQEFQHVLVLGLLLPSSPEVNEYLLWSAHHEGWWDVFEQLLQRLPEQERGGWLALRAAARGEWRQALSVWQSANSAWQPFAQQLARQLSLRDDLQNQDLAVRMAAWEAWQQQAPGVKPLWKNAASAVRQHAGGLLLDQPDLGIHTQYYRASANESVELQLSGPGVLRVRVRPLHPALQSNPEANRSDWLMVEAQGQTQAFPVYDNHPDEGRRFVSDERLPGRRVTFEIPLSDGQQLLRFRSDTGDLALQFEQLQAATRLPLSRPHPGLLAELRNQPLFHATQTPFGLPVEIIEDCKVSTVNLDGAALPQWPSFDASQSTRRTDADPESVIESRLRNMLWQVYREPHRAPELVAQAESLLETRTPSRTQRSLLLRLQRYVDWRLVENVDDSAGIYRERLAQRRASSDGARIRAAMQEPLGADERRLRGHEQLELLIENNARTALRLDVTLEELAYDRPQPLRIGFALDGQEEQEILLDAAQQTRTLVRHLPPGRHQLGLRILQPVLNQSVRIRIREKHSDGRYRPLDTEESRNWWLATAQQPLRIRLRGPGRVRVDELQGDAVISEYRTLQAGWQSLELAAEQAHDERWLRVYQLQAASGSSVVPARRVLRTRQTLAPVNWPAIPEAAMTVATSDPEWDAWEAGTWSWAAGVVRRRNIEEDVSPGVDAEEFLELKASHRQYFSSLDLYHRLDLLGRAHRDGGPAFAAREWLDFDTDRLRLNFGLRASLWLQDPDGDGLQHLFDLRGDVSQRRVLGPRAYHVPSASLFRRWLSMDGPLAERPERVDQDVYSEYKAQHQAGLAVGDTWFYYPWNDTQIFAGLGLNTNEDLNPLRPDHLRMRLGGRQLIGDFLLGAEYLQRNYRSDGDRPDASRRARLRLSLDWLRWTSQRNAWQAGLQLDHDRETGENSIQLTLQWHNSRARFLHDFRPEETPFANLRLQRAAGLLYAPDQSVTHEEP